MGRGDGLGADTDGDCDNVNYKAEMARRRRRKLNKQEADELHEEWEAGEEEAEVEEEAGAAKRPATPQPGQDDHSFTYNLSANRRAPRRRGGEIAGDGW